MTRIEEMEGNIYRIEVTKENESMMISFNGYFQRVDVDEKDVKPLEGGLHLEID